VSKTEEGEAAPDTLGEARYVRGNALNKNRGWSYAALWQAFTLTVRLFLAFRQRRAFFCTARNKPGNWLDELKRPFSFQHQPA
jgi:hypothetical protein